MINFDILRANVLRAGNDASFTIDRARAIINIQEESLQISIAVPKREGEAFAHWRYLQEQGIVRTSNNGRSGLGKADSRVDGLTSKGIDFLELSRDDEVWHLACERCRLAGALTLANVLRELRREARQRIKNHNPGGPNG